MLRLRHLTIAGAIVASTLALTLVASGGASGASLPNTKVIPGACALDLSANHSHCDLNLIATLKGRAKAAAAPTAGYGPADLQSAYALPSSGGTGQTVAIVDAYGRQRPPRPTWPPTAPTTGCRACTTANGCFKKVNQSGVQGSYPANNQGWALETQLDLEMVSAVCPNCKILLVEATNNLNASLYAAEDTAARLGATEISNSYGGSESSSETADDAHFNHPGVADHRLLGRQRLRRRVPGGLAVRHRGRRHLAEPRVGARAAGPRPPGAARAAAARRTRPSRRGRPTPAARGARSRTSPRSPTRTRASPCTTATAT